MMTENERNAAVQLSQSLANTVYALRHLEVTPDAIRDFVNVSIQTFAEADDKLYNSEIQREEPKFQEPKETVKVDLYVSDESRLTA